MTVVVHLQVLVHEWLSLECWCSVVVETLSLQQANPFKSSIFMEKMIPKCFKVASQSRHVHTPFIGYVREVTVPVLQALEM